MAGAPLPPERTVGPAERKGGEGASPRILSRLDRARVWDGGEGRAGERGRETGSKRVRMERDRGRIVLSDGMQEIGEKGRSETDPGLGERERERERERAREWEKKRSRGNG